MGWALPLSTLIISGAALVVSTLLASRSLSRSASSDWVDQLEKRVAECERDRSQQRIEITTLRDQNYDLLRRLMKLEDA